MPPRLVHELPVQAAAVGSAAEVPRAVCPAPDPAMDDVCPICLCTCEEPQLLPCDHLLCKGCLQQMYRHGVTEVCGGDGLAMDEGVC